MNEITTLYTTSLRKNWPTLFFFCSLWYTCIYDEWKSVNGLDVWSYVSMCNWRLPCNRSRFVVDVSIVDFFSPSFFLSIFSYFTFHHRFAKQGSKALHEKSGYIKLYNHPEIRMFCASIWFECMIASESAVLGDSNECNWNGWNLHIHLSL